MGREVCVPSNDKMVCTKRLVSIFPTDSDTLEVPVVLQKYLTESPNRSVQPLYLVLILVPQTMDIFIYKTTTKSFDFGMPNAT